MSPYCAKAEDVNQTTNAVTLFFQYLVSHSTSFNILDGTEYIERESHTVGA